MPAVSRCPELCISVVMPDSEKDKAENATKKIAEMLMEEAAVPGLPQG